MKRVIALVVLSLVLVGFSSASETEDQFRLFSFAEKGLMEKVNVRMQFVMPNLVTSHNPLLYLGLSFRLTEKFRIGVMTGKRFKEENDHRAVLLLSYFDPNKWLVCVQTDWCINKKSVWQITQLRRFVGSNGFWVGAEMENIYGSDSRFISVGPNVGVCLSKRVLLSLTYFVKWTPNERFGVIRGCLILNLGD